MSAKRKPKPAAKHEPEKRPFTTDYGPTQGHCASKESAGACAFNAMFRHGRRHVTIEGPNGKALVRYRRDGFWGIYYEIPGHGLKVVGGTEPPHLRRVKR